MWYVFWVLFQILISLTATAANTCFSQLSGLKSIYQNAGELRQDILNSKSIRHNPIIAESIFNTKVDVHSLAQNGVIKNSFLRKRAADLLERLDQETMSFPEYLETAYDAVAFFELETQFQSKKLFRELEDAYRFNRQQISKIASQDYLRRVEGGHLYLPINRDLSIEEMNNLWLIGIKPLGVVARPTEADLSVRTPVQFYNHDSAHAIAAGKFTRPNELSHLLYFQIKNEIQSLNPSVQDAIERIIFYSTHERGGDLSSKQYVLNTFASGIDVKIRYNSKLTKKQIKEFAKIMVPRKIGFVTALDFVRHPETKQLAEDWEAAMNYLNQ